MRRNEGDQLKIAFDSKVNREGRKGCWLWTGNINPKTGRARIRIPNRGKQGASRIAWELYKGPIPKGLCVLHTCDNPICVNPNHLYLGTRADNLRDMYERHPTRLSRKRRQSIM